MTEARADRVRGGLLGSLVGDALGVPVEFSPRARLDADPVTDLRGHGVHNQPAGTWSDDGSMALCLTESLVERGGFDLADQADRWRRWIFEGHWTPHGVVFDCGGTTREALFAVARGDPLDRTGGRAEHSNGNGSLMRALPLAVRLADEPDAVLLERAHASSAVTHAHPRSLIGCGLHAFLVRHLLRGAAPFDALEAMREDARRAYGGPAWKDELDRYALLIDGDLAAVPRAGISGSGYVVDCLVASVWCLLRGADWRETTLAAVNLGDDTDTTGAVAGGLAGLCFGVDSIPAAWREAIARRAEVEALLERFVAATST